MDRLELSAARKKEFRRPLGRDKHPDPSRAECLNAIRLGLDDVNRGLRDQKDLTNLVDRWVQANSFQLDEATQQGLTARFKAIHDAWKVAQYMRFVPAPFSTFRKAAQDFLMYAAENIRSEEEANLGITMGEKVPPDDTTSAVNRSIQLENVPLSSSHEQVSDRQVAENLRDSAILGEDIGREVEEFLKGHKDSSFIIGFRGWTRQKYQQKIDYDFDEYKVLIKKGETDYQEHFTKLKDMKEELEQYIGDVKLLRSRDFDQLAPRYRYEILEQLSRSYNQGVNDVLTDIENDDERLCAQHSIVRCRKYRNLTKKSLEQWEGKNGEQDPPFYVYGQLRLLRRCTEQQLCALEMISQGNGLQEQMQVGPLREQLHRANTIEEYSRIIEEYYDKKVEDILLLHHESTNLQRKLQDDPPGKEALKSEFSSVVELAEHVENALRESRWKEVVKGFEHLGRAIDDLLCIHAQVHRTQLSTDYYESYRERLKQAGTLSEQQEQEYKIIHSRLEQTRARFFTIAQFGGQPYNQERQTALAEYQDVVDEHFRFTNEMRQGYCQLHNNYDRTVKEYLKSIKRLDRKYKKYKNILRKTNKENLESVYDSYVQENYSYMDQINSALLQYASKRGTDLNHLLGEAKNAFDNYHQCFNVLGNNIDLLEQNFRKAAQYYLQCVQKMQHQAHMERFFSEKGLRPLTEEEIQTKRNDFHDRYDAVPTSPPGSYVWWTDGVDSNRQQEFVKEVELHGRSDDPWSCYTNAFDPVTADLKGIRGYGNIDANENGPGRMRLSDIKYFSVENVQPRSLTSYSILEIDTEETVLDVIEAYKQAIGQELTEKEKNGEFSFLSGSDEFGQITFGTVLGKSWVYFLGNYYPELDFTRVRLKIAEWELVKVKMITYYLEERQNASSREANLRITMEGEVSPGETTPTERNSIQLEAVLPSDSPYEQEKDFHQARDGGV